MIGHVAARGQVYAAHFLWQAGTKGQRIMPQGRRLCLARAPLGLSGFAPRRGHSERTCGWRQVEKL